MRRIPVLTPQDAELLLKYFTGVDATVAKRFQLGFQPDEEHLTSLLCELLDDRGAALHAMEYTVEDLNKDFAEIGSLLDASISLETREYNKHQERNFTQADLGIILEYRDHINLSLSFRKGLLLQAKKLFPENGEHYGLAGRYRSFAVDQHNRLMKLRDHYREFYIKQRCGDDKELEMRRHMPAPEDCHKAFQYLLYNPPLSSLSKREQEEALHNQFSRETGHIFDYTHGLCLYETLKRPNGLKRTLDIASLVLDLDNVHSIAEAAASSGRSKSKLAPFDFRAVIEAVDIRQRSFPWYLVFEFILGEVGCDLPEFLQLVAGGGDGASKDMMISPPRFVLRITLTAGTNPEGNNVDLSSK